MTQRVTPIDATFLYAERAGAALHVGGVLTFGPPPGGVFDVAAFTELVGRRVALVPRLRQTVRAVPGRLGGPVWVDDGRFDLAYHVRHLALPAPGTDAVLRELVAALLETPLDRGRPLWEVCVVEGLADGRTALVAKIHHALADGVACMRLGALLLDATADSGDLSGGVPDGWPDDDWRPAPAPSDLALAAGAALHAVTSGRATLGSAFGAAVAAALSAAGSFPAPGSPPRPAAAGRSEGSGLAGALGSASTGASTGAAGGPTTAMPGAVADAVNGAMLSAMGGAVARVVTGAVSGALDGAVRVAGPAPVPALRVATGPRRRFGTLRATLADHRTVRRAHGGTVNDVVLAVVAGGLRRWLAGRGQEPSVEVCVRALVPVSVRGRGRDTGGVPVGGNAISAHLVDLPVGLDDPLERLARVRAAMDERKRRGPAPVDALSALAGAAPTALHELGARLAGRHVGRLYDVLVSNVPGPPRALYARGAPLLDLFPAVPLGAGQAVAVGVVSYAGGLHYGLTTDGDAVPDVDDLTAALEEALAELVVRSPRPARPAGAPAGPAHDTAGFAAV